MLGSFKFEPLLWNKHREPSLTSVFPLQTWGLDAVAVETTVPSAGMFPLEVAFVSRVPSLGLEFASPVTDVAIVPFAGEVVLNLVLLLGYSRFLIA